MGKGQGAVEYLILLAIVLIIATVTIALLGFFPGTAKDTKVAESQIYWSGIGGAGSPITISSFGKAYFVFPDYCQGTNVTCDPKLSTVYFTVKNSGNYPITLTKLLGGNNASISAVNSCKWTGNNFNCTNNVPIALNLQPGEEACFGTTSYFDGPCMEREVDFTPVGGYSPNQWDLPAAISMCDQFTGKGTLTLKNFGFEYIENIGGATLTKKQVGAVPLQFDCAGSCPFNGYLATCSQDCPTGFHGC